MAPPIFLAILPVIFFLLCVIQAKDTLIPGEYLTAPKTLVSSNGVFELGFFSRSPSNFYLGIWFKNDPDQKPVWVANRQYPILDSPGDLGIRYDGNLEIRDRRQIPIIVNSGMVATAPNTSAKLFDSGNLVLQERDKVVWQSFNYPSDTFLPDMRIGLYNLDTDHWRKEFILSWQSPSLPATGSFVCGLQTDNKTSLRVWHGEDFSREIGSWDGHKFNLFFQNLLGDYNFSYISNDNETYLTFSTRANDSFSWFVMSSTGEIQEYKMIGKNISMVSHSVCGNSTASNETACYIGRPSVCQDGDVFSKTKVLMPNSIIVNESAHLGISDCEIMCRSNCSCSGFASHRDDGTGCEFYYGDKSVLLETIGKGNGTLFIRGDKYVKSGKKPAISDYQKRRRLLLIIFLPIVSLGVMVVVCLICYLRWINHSFTEGWKGWLGSKRGSRDLLLHQLGKKKEHELLELSFYCMARATNNFSAAKKLGEGGFGPVYKGVLLGHEIAVKRLSRWSGQGLEEFKNEVQLISKLQHRNLVQLLGCCVEKEEKILVYEYMANNSLDSFLFDPTKKTSLNWANRFCIIEGIAQGLLYLHKYSRLRIIHRDLKTSNILLDSHMNPKISDFGMARIFEEGEAQTKTTRVVGTYGYMSPEYAIHGCFSIKSDVFSFGVIMLEIISGRKNITFCRLDRSLNLLGYAWGLWKDGKGMEFMDPTLANSCLMAEELIQCIQVALLCVQERPEDRPTMSDVVSMLSNESTFLPDPKQPAFSTDLDYADSHRQQTYSENGVTMSVMVAR